MSFDVSSDGNLTTTPADIGPVWLDPLPDGSYMLRSTKPDAPTVRPESLSEMMLRLRPIILAEWQKISATSQPPLTSQPASTPMSLDR